jgi:hypothetical protein
MLDAVSMSMPLALCKEQTGFWSSGRALRRTIEVQEEQTEGVNGLAIRMQCTAPPSWDSP